MITFPTVYDLLWHNWLHLSENSSRWTFRLCLCVLRNFVYREDQHWQHCLLTCSVLLSSEWHTTSAVNGLGLYYHTAWSFHNIWHVIPQHLYYGHGWYLKPCDLMRILSNQTTNRVKIPYIYTKGGTQAILRDQGPDMSAVQK